MPVGFYELLQVAPDASLTSLRAAWQEQIAQVVRRQRAAEARQQDTAAIDTRRAALAEAWAVLSDPARRRRYDRFRELTRTGLPADPDELWTEASRSLVDPAAAAALEVLRVLTDLRMGDPPGVPLPPPEPDVSSVHLVPPPELAVLDENFQANTVPIPTSAPSRRSSRVAFADPGTTRVAATLHPVSNEMVARLFDQYGPSGAYLVALRELRGSSLDDVSSTTRVTRRFLEAMERDAYHELPGATFVRGYLKMVLRAMDALDGPDTDEFVEGYMSRFHRARG